MTFTCLDSQNDPAFCLTSSRSVHCQYFPLITYCSDSSYESFFPSFQNIVTIYLKFIKKLHINHRGCSNTISTRGKEINSIPIKVLRVFTTERGGGTPRHRMQNLFSVPYIEDNRFLNNSINTDKFRHNNYTFLGK